MNEKEKNSFNFEKLKENKDLFVNKTNSNNRPKNQSDINIGLIGYLKFLNIVIILLHLAYLIITIIQEQGRIELETIKIVSISLITFIPIISIGSILGYVLKQINNLWSVTKEIINKKEMEK